MMVEQGRVCAHIFVVLQSIVVSWAFCELKIACDDVFQREAKHGPVSWS